jgi:hypothetical protein
VYVAAVAACIAPPVLLGSDIALVRFISTPGLILQRIALVLFIPALAGIGMIAGVRARRQVGAAAMLAIIGAAAIAMRPEALVVPIRPPAILFPVGLLAVAAALLGSDLRRVGGLMAAGAALFPVGHVGGSAPVLFASDALLLVAFWQLARRMASANPKSQIPNSKSQGRGR